MKKYICLTLLCFSLMFLTACWNYREVDKLSLLAGVAIDKDKKTDQYELTAEIIDVTSTGKDSTFDSLLLEYSAKSIYDASRSMISISAKPLLWSHATAVIISEDIAKDGFTHILDWLARNQESRLDLYIFIAQTDKAKDILKLEALTTPIKSFEMSTIIESSKKSSIAPNVDAYELINIISTKGIDPVVPTVKEKLTQGHKTMQVSGGAVIKDSKFVGYIDEEEIKSYLLASNKFESGILTVDISKKENKIKEENITIEILKSNTKVRPIVLDDNLKMEIKIKVESKISTIDSTLDIMKEKNILKVKASIEEKIKKDVLTLIKKMQLEYSADIFGFGENVKDNMPKLWKQIEDDWDNIYKDLQVDLDVNVHIRGSGHFSKTKGI